LRPPLIRKRNTEEEREEEHSSKVAKKGTKASTRLWREKEMDKVLRVVYGIIREKRWT